MQKEQYKSSMTRPIIIDVDANGLGPAGEVYTVRADPHQVMNGLVVELAVVLRHPDGSLTMGSRVRATAEGVAAGVNV